MYSGSSSGSEDDSLILPSIPLHHNQPSSVLPPPPGSPDGSLDSIDSEALYTNLDRLPLQRSIHALDLSNPYPYLHPVGPSGTPSSYASTPSVFTGGPLSYNPGSTANALSSSILLPLAYLTRFPPRSVPLSHLTSYAVLYAPSWSAHLRSYRDLTALDVIRAESLLDTCLRLRAGEGGDDDLKMVRDAVREAVEKAAEVGNGEAAIVGERGDVRVR